MANKTKIEWCGATWNPVVGCSKVSDGCSNCYAERIVKRFPHLTGYWDGPHRKDERPIGWDGQAHFMPNKLEQPFHWRKPRRIFVCSMGDLFHESIYNEHIAAVFCVMASCPQHTFCVLTKRHKRMFDWFTLVSCNAKRFDITTDTYCQKEAYHIVDNFPLHNVKGTFKSFPWPLPNVWLGVSVENQITADERIPTLLQVPAAKRYISIEPMLDSIDIEDVPVGMFGPLRPKCCELVRLPKTDWVICGAETGPGKRPMDLDWARSVRDQCQASCVPFFFKKDSNGNRELDGRLWEEVPNGFKSDV